MKVIFHLDIDSYFVSAERTINPNLKGKMVVISDARKRSIIAAASYEAKEIGINSPMPFHEAKKICPELVAIKANFPLYTVLSTKYFELLSSQFTNKIEVASIDECFMDVTNIWQKYGSPIKLAKQIQNYVLKELKLPISIGISSNKFVAKMSTQINKPFGISITKPGDFKKKFGNWDVGKIYGIGKPTEKILNRNGIKIALDIINSSEQEMEEILGKRGVAIYNNVIEKGDDNINIQVNELKGIGNSTTFMDEDKSERYEILEILKHLCSTVSIRLNNRNLAATSISISIKDSGGHEIRPRSKQTTLNRPIFKFQDIFNEATWLFDNLWEQQPIKFIGISTSKLVDVFDKTFQQSIFDSKVEASKVQELINNMNTKLGHKTLVTLKEKNKNIKKEQNQSRFLEADRVINKYNKK